MNLQASYSLIALIAFALLVNLPLGYLRAGARKYSAYWFAYVHLSIPFIVLLRLEQGLTWRVIPLTLGSTVAGQYLGGLLRNRRKQ